jgi:hypothetical protein
MEYLARRTIMRANTNEQALTRSHVGTTRSRQGLIMFKIVIIALLTMGLTPISVPAASQDASNSAMAARAGGLMPFLGPYSIWSDFATPDNSLANDGQPIDVGVKFRADIDGYIVALRFYKGAGNTGSHVGQLWKADGTALLDPDGVTFTGETASGWQQVALAAPIPVLANTTYVASVHSSDGYYSFTGNGLSSGVDNPPLHAPAGSPADHNGVYKYGASGFPTFPTDGADSNYWVDVVFDTNPVDTTPPTISKVLAVPSGQTALISWSTNEPADSLVSYGTALNALTLTATDAGLVKAHSLTLSGLTLNTTYYYRVTSKDASNNATTTPATGDPPLSFSALATACPCSIWPSPATPINDQATDMRPIEVGVKFRTDVDGYITGLRFYKGAANTGEHVGHLWQADGKALLDPGGVTFAGETASGWQQVALAAPIPVLANTTYVASYYSPSGYFAMDTGAFATTGVDNPPLHALASGMDGPNGVYLWDTSGFPTGSSTNNYWVDVVFNTTPAPPVVSVEYVSPGVLLKWQHLFASITSYEIRGNSTPYGNPALWPLLSTVATLPAPGATISYPNTPGAQGFYSVRGANTSGAVTSPSSQVGIFRFPLIPGS